VRSLRVFDGFRAYREGVLLLPQISPRPGDHPVIRTQRPRPELGDPPERLPRLVPVAQLLGHHPQIVGDLQNQRIGVTQPELPRRVGFLEHPPSRHRIVGPLQRRAELTGREQHLRVVLGEIDLAKLHRTLQQQPRRPQIPGVGERLSTLPDGKERRGLRHVRHAARCARWTPGRVVVRAAMPGIVRRRPSMRGAVGGVYSSLLCGPLGCRYPAGSLGSVAVG
jgi:hypothetical protein